MEESKVFGSSGEVAKYLYISKSTLIEYEERGLLRPDLMVGSGHRRYLWKNVVEFRKTYELKEIPKGVDLVSAKEVCNYLGITVSVLKQLDECGELTPCLSLPPRNRKFYIPADVNEYITSIQKKSE